MFEFKHAADEIPRIDVPRHCHGLILYFNELRSFIGDIDKPITMTTITDWQSHSYVSLARWERDCMFACDRALRHSYSDVLKFHAKRTKIKVKQG